MKRFSFSLVFIVSLTLPFFAIAQEVYVHEAWFVHMESAGGWVAADKGFYGKVRVNEVSEEQNKCEDSTWSLGPKLF